MKKKAALAARPRLVAGGSSLLADRLHVSRTHMSMIMHGTRNPGPRLAARLRRLGVEWPLPGLARKGGAK